MKYRELIEDNFLIDDAETGELVPFRFNKVQALYYKTLCKEYDIEKNGLNVPIREDILKARKEGFTSLILALFAADDITNENPTESQVVSYKDDATEKFRKRYRFFVLSYFANKHGWELQERKNPVLLEKLAKTAFYKDEDGNYELRHNRAHFTCGTASARTGARGSTMHKILYSEAAHYPDSEKITAREIIDGGSQQMSKKAGWIFIESTANGPGNYFHTLYWAGKRGQVRYRSRFYGWREFYTEAEFEVIKSDFTDLTMLKQEYPENDEEAFQSSVNSFTSLEKLGFMVGVKAKKEILAWEEYEHTNYIEQCELIKSFLEGLERQYPYQGLYAGIDVAKQIDSTVLTVELETFKSTGGVRGIGIDSTGAGDFMPDWFAKNARWYIVPVRFSAPMKDILYKNLDTVITSKLTSLPEMGSKEAKRFLLQMQNLQKERRGQLIAVHHPNVDKHPQNCNKDTCIYHDDYPDSFALAEHVYVDINGVPESTKKPAKVTNQDAMSSFLTARDDSNKGMKSFE